ncbi:hypothetical protein [Aquimarina spongiae]|uniref:Mono-oxygenase ydhR n=1 Tax=Aquimarina spongiae TaxID=570521 RepID=A0A1M6GM12_9FLAO|nr:hypothetical protein [Aquimarina spongiae]SHJ10916.1 hypothetical protein SAMN04488508_105344 [Aquimarina spongiae]
MQGERTIVHLKFQSTLTELELKKIVENRKEKVREIKGLFSFYCHYNDETKTLGATYIFENIDLARAYIGNFMINGLGPKYGIIPMTLKIDMAQIKKEFQF